MPLQIEAPEEHPEVTALKKRVVEVADQYTARHGWCREVKAALRDAGITQGEMLLVEITFTVAGSEETKTTQRYQLSDLAGKSDEEQKAFVAEKISPKVNVGGSQVTIPVTIADLNQVDGSVAKGGLTYPDNMLHFYSSSSGRVAHLMHMPREVIDGRMSGEDYFTRRTVPMYALCGEVAYHPLIESPRSESRLCARCERQIPSA